MIMNTNPNCPSFSHLLAFPHTADQAEARKPKPVGERCREQLGQPGLRHKELSPPSAILPSATLSSSSEPLT